MSKDYGEPWSAMTSGNIFDTTGRCRVFTRDVQDMSTETQLRIVDSVNAVAGMANPAAEIAALKEVAEAGQQFLDSWNGFDEGENFDLRESFRAALRKLKEVRND